MIAPMRRGLTITAVTLACSATAPPPPPPPPPPPARAADLDTEDCRGTANGRLFTRWGSFWFDAAASEHGSARTQTLLSVRDDSAAAGHAPWYGTVLPLADSTFGVCVRSYHPRRSANSGELPPDALVKIDGRGLHPEVLYTSGHRLHLIGRVSGAILLAELVRDGHQLVALDGSGHEIARSRAIVFPPGAVDDRRTELPLRTAAPLNLHRVAITGERDHVFVAEVVGQQVELRDTGALAEQGLALRGNAVVLRRRANRCVVPGRLPPARWRARAAAPCPREGIVTDGDGLTVDGALVSGVRGDAQRCQVRASVTFPGAGESAGSGVTVLADRSVTGERIDMELLVRGRHLSVGFTPSDGAGALTVPDGFGVALPQGALVAREVTADDATLWRVRLSADIPLRALPTCLQGRWVVRAWSDEAESEDATATRFDELGTCD